MEEICGTTCGALPMELDVQSPVRGPQTAIQSICTPPEVGQGFASHPTKGHGSQGWLLAPPASQHLAMPWEEP